ncbi:hypothetical protein KI688_007177 [Linnemannia hyalina]|uniref:Uncharacterized protein n=1 Tax=Linnemannia hyalina TaxID=64524 RepID=A0A9P8BMZ4_9FUNG|nr:hypothetical protein KI688_007177 [Linnemannia hyalina]
MPKDRLDTMLGSVGEPYEDSVEKFMETHELREYSALFDTLSKNCQELLGSTATILPRGTQNWLEGFAERLKARETLKQTSKTFDLATEILGNSTRSHLAGAFKPAPAPAPAPDESVLGSSTALPSRSPLHQGAQYIQGSTAGLTVPSAVPLTVDDLEVEGESTVQHTPAAEPSVRPDPSEPDSPLIEENDEIAELRTNLDRSSHAICEWKVNNDCVACRFQDYQRECINALNQKLLKRGDVADVMALIGVFAPFIPTPRMTSVFGRMLDHLLTSVKFPAPHIDDLAIMKAVRQRLNGERDEACETIRSLDRKKRIMFETLMEKLPMKSDKTISEGTFVTNYVPNTECQTQKQQGIKADRPDILIKIRGQEAVFGEVTGPAQAGHTAKNAWDLFRLARFGKAFLDHGNSVAPLLQIVYNNGTFMCLTIKTRGMFILEEIGSFEVPTKVAAIPALAATIPTLLAARILDGNMNTLKRSWGYGDVPDAKKRLS